MFTLFSRRAHRPRTTRRPSLRPALRVEALEARANPDANPTLSNVTAVWTNATQVVISGTVTDGSATTAGATANATTTPTTVFVGGATTAAVTTNPQGNFSIALTVDQPGTLLLAAQPTTATLATPVTVIADGQPTLSNVTISQGDDGAWHIRGQVTGNDPVGTVITIISQIPSINGETNVVQNADGTFDIGIVLPQDSPGGTVTITLGDGDGDVFDQWSGSIF